MRKTNNIVAEQVLNSGYYASQFQTASLEDGSLTGTSVARPDGVLECCVVGSLSVAGGTGFIRIVVEGSNDDTNWHTIAQSAQQELLSADGDIVALNGLGGSVVVIDRWVYVRVRAVEINASSYDWTLSVALTGIKHNGDAQVLTFTNTRSAATDNSDSQYRVPGTRYATVQVVCGTLTLGAATSISVDLQGSPDDGTTWITIADQISITATGSQQMEQDGNKLIDLGHFNTLRLQTADVGGAATTYVVELYVAVDSCDWFSAVPVGGFSSIPSTLNTMLAQVVNDDPEAEAANARDLTFRLLRLDGSPLEEQVVLRIILYDTQYAGVNDLATNATVSAVTAGTLISAAANDVTVRTTTGGIVTVTISDVAAETIYAAAVLDGVVNATTRLVIVQSPEVPVAFA